jgi:hypothetical protein
MHARLADNPQPATPLTPERAAKLCAEARGTIETARKLIGDSRALLRNIHGHGPPYLPYG